jgi:hypothetical protein
MEKVSVQLQKTRRSRDQRVKCSIPGCNRILSGYRGLKSHLQAHKTQEKKKSEEPDPTRLFKCGVAGCVKAYRRKEPLLSHLKKHSLEERNAIIEILF